MKFKIPQAVPLHGTITCKDLASLVDLPEGVLARVMRYSISLGVFSEPTAGEFAHTSLSATLATNEDVRNIVFWNTEEITAITTKLGDALKHRQQNKGSTTAGFNLAYRTDETVFDFFSKTADSSDRYHKYLAGRGNLPRWSTDHVVKIWDWAALGSGTVIDVQLSISFP